MLRKMYVTMPSLNGMAPIIGEVQPEGDNEVLEVQYFDSEFTPDDEEEEG
jgi:hypothetical protein